MIEVKTADKNKKEVCINKIKLMYTIQDCFFLKILPILVLCNEIVSDERRSNFTQNDVEQWTAKDKCFG